MRIAFTVIFAVLILALLICAHKARSSHKSVGMVVMHLLLALIPPLAGNLILVISTHRELSVVGCYIYFMGMDLVMLALLRFTSVYCYITWPKVVRIIVDALLALDALQLLLNIVFGHAFGTEMVEVSGLPYYRLVPYLGQTFHRAVDYGILIGVLTVFTVKMIRSPRINSERYSVILIAMVFTTLWQTAYIFSRTPVDRSMIGFGVFGLLVYFLALYYRPLRLLDSMLAAVASEIPDALFFYDVNGRCIWANKRGFELTGTDGSDCDATAERLEKLLGDTGEKGISWSGSHVSGSGDKIQSYVMERRTVTDDRSRTIGSFLTVRDNSDDQKLLQKEIYKATHDSLTQVYNRSGYDLLMTRVALDKTMFLLLDGDNFKQVNDRYGHETGDRTLQKIARTIRQFFRTDDFVCRIGGDEFVVLMNTPGEPRFDLVRDRISGINAALAIEKDGVPPISVSVGAAQGDKASDAAELFDRADRALYETKRSGRCGVTFYDEM